MLRDLLQSPACEIENRRPQSRLFLSSFTKKKKGKGNESNTTVNINIEKHRRETPLESLLRVRNSRRDYPI